MIIKEWKVPASIEGTIIDIETTALQPPGEIITYGFFFGNTIKIFQRTDLTEEGKEKFEKGIKKAFFFYPRPYYAYNCSFEEQWLGIKFDHDLMEKWRKEAESVVGDNGRRLKWPKVSELISLPHEYFKIKAEATGREIPEIWQKYKDTGKEEFLAHIINHNLYDLIRESCLMLWDETIAKALKGLMEEEKWKKEFK